MRFTSKTPVTTMRKPHAAARQPSPQQAPVAEASPPRPASPRLRKVCLSPTLSRRVAKNGEAPTPTKVVPRKAASPDASMRSELDTLVKAAATKFHRQHSLPIGIVRDANAGGAAAGAEPSAPVVLSTPPVRLTRHHQDPTGDL
jgi:hypothetical protein